MSKVVFVSIEGDLALDVGDVWPDDDVPERLSAEAVAEVMYRDGRSGRSKVLADWGLLDDLRVTVRVQNPHWRPDPPLLPDWAPPRWVETEVFS